MAYVRTKEKISQTRQRVAKLMFDSDDSETDSESKSEQKQAFWERHRLDQSKAKEHDNHIRRVIKQLRKDAKAYLGVADSKSLPLTQIYDKLQRSADYKKKRELKSILKSSKDDLQSELKGIETQLHTFIG